MPVLFYSTKSEEVWKHTLKLKTLGNATIFKLLISAFE